MAAKLKTIQIQASMGSGCLVSSDIRGHKVAIDQPKPAGGNDSAPSPLEYFLFSLGGCIASIGRIVAKQQKIDLRGMEVQVTGEMNPAGLMGANTDDPVGFKRIDVQAEINADLSDTEKQAFLDEVCRRCPVHDNLHGTAKLSHCLSPETEVA